MLKTLDEFKDAALVRTRDESIIQKADIVVDVGGIYDLSQCRFDHHQRGFEETFDADHKIKLSSAGLIYKHYGQKVIAQLLNWPQDHQELPFLHKKVYDSLIEMFDGVDNGVEQYPEGVEAAYSDSTSISARVSRLNPRWNQETNQTILDKQFQKAVEMTGEELVACVENIALSWLPARDIVKQGFEQRKEFDPSGKIIVLPQYCPFKSHLYLF
jgi:uncharacterized UPF0160 family protein